MSDSDPFEQLGKDLAKLKQEAEDRAKKANDLRSQANAARVECNQKLFTLANKYNIEDSLIRLAATIQAAKLQNRLPRLIRTIDTGDSYPICDVVWQYDQSYPENSQLDFGPFSSFLHEIKTIHWILIIHDLDRSSTGGREFFALMITLSPNNTYRLYSGNLLYCRDEVLHINDRWNKYTKTAGQRVSAFDPPELLLTSAQNIRHNLSTVAQEVMHLTELV